MQTKSSLVDALHRKDIDAASQLLSEGIMMPVDRESYFYMMMSFVCDHNKEAISWLLENCPLAKDYSDSVLTTAFCDNDWDMVSLIRQFCPDSALSEPLLLDAYERGDFNVAEGLVYVRDNDQALADSFVPIYFTLMGQHPMAHLSELPFWMQKSAVIGVRQLPSSRNQ